MTDYSINSSFETDTQKRNIHLEYAKSFAEVPHSALQVLCKEFNIKANTKNDEMRHALSLRVHSDNQVMGALQEVLKSKSLTKRVKTKD
jgi:hypothetical protein